MGNIVLKLCHFVVKTNSSFLTILEDELRLHVDKEQDTKWQKILIDEAEQLRNSLQLIFDVTHTPRISHRDVTMTGNQFNDEGVYHKYGIREWYFAAISFLIFFDT